MFDWNLIRFFSLFSSGQIFNFAGSNLLDCCLVPAVPHSSFACPERARCSVCLSVCLYVFFCLSFSLAVCLSLSLAVALPPSPFLCLCVHLYLSYSVRLSSSLSMSVSFSCFLSRSFYTCLPFCVSFPHSHFVSYFQSLCLFVFLSPSFAWLVLCTNTNRQKFARKINWKFKLIFHSDENANKFGCGGQL